jgi:hypothetical protein
MTEITIEQATLSRSAGGWRTLARSAGFLDEWQAEAERLAEGFGERPEGVACPAAVFARPLGTKHIAVVQVADQGDDGSGRPAALGFHFLVIPKGAYMELWGDPFALAERAPPPWHVRGSLPTLTWSAEPLPPRTVADVRQVLQRVKAAALPEDEEIPADWDAEDVTAPGQSEGPALLGGVQVLVDGGRLVFERPAPDPGLVRGLWTLLPTTTRCRLWPASFAFGNALGFDALVVPPAARGRDAFAGYTDEEQACDYPQGHYELNLQIAAEAGNQAELDALFGRRSSAETLRIGVMLLVVFSVVALALNFLHAPAERQPDPQAEADRRARAAIAAGMVGMGSPWNTLGLYPAARHVWYEIGEKASRKDAKAPR